MIDLCIDQVVREALQDDGKKTVMTKSSSVDLVTQTDQKVEQLIIQSVKEKFPTHRLEAPPPWMCYWISAELINSVFEEMFVSTEFKKLKKRRESHSSGLLNYEC